MLTDQGLLQSFQLAASKRDALGQKESERDQSSEGAQSKTVHEKESEVNIFAREESEDPNDYIGLEYVQLKYYELI